MKRNEAGARAVRDAHGHSGGRGRPARSHYGEMPLAAWGGTEDAAPKRRRCAAWLYRQSPHPVPNLRGSSALRRTPQRMAFGGSPLCACPRVAGGASALARDVGGAPQGGARFERHGPRKAMRSATTTMLRLAALHLPSPFLRRERGTPRARVKREGLCDTHALSRGERIPRGCLTIESESRALGPRLRGDDG